jgi:hypothetical protein
VGQFVTAGSSWSQGICSIVEGEANALLEAMKEMEHKGFNYIIVETDSKNVADAICKSRVGNSVFRSLIYSIKNVISFSNYFRSKIPCPLWYANVNFCHCCLLLVACFLFLVRLFQ